MIVNKKREKKYRENNFFTLFTVLFKSINWVNQIRQEDLNFGLQMRNWSRKASLVGSLCGQNKKGKSR
jgi:hypothetical protein